MTISAPNREVMLYGTTAPDAQGRILTAGPLSLEFDNGALRYIRIGSIEVLRQIAFIVRDENWGTYAAEVSGLRVGSGGDGFNVSYEASCAGGDLTYQAEIKGRPDGSLDFTVDARADRDFRTNRTGFMVLHPLKGCAGQPVEVLHVDGTRETAQFPVAVSPLQPFYEIRALTHRFAPGARATVRFEGDTFEMEDHRNWTDASYKTYVRPLALPWPYTIASGEELRQAVSLRIEGTVPERAQTDQPGKLHVEVGAATRRCVPLIGLGVPAAEIEPALAAGDLLQRVQPQLLLCQLDPGQGHGQAEFEGYRRLADAIDANPVLEFVLPCREDIAVEVDRAAADIQAAGLAPTGIAVSPAADLKGVLPGSPWPEVPPLAAIYEAVHDAVPEVKLGGGTFAFFTELNRKRPPIDRLDWVRFTTCPITHAADDRSVMETLEALPYVVDTVRTFIGGKQYRVGPSSIGARDNPYGTTTSSNPDNGRVPLAENDPRQRGLFGAAWVLGYIAAFAHGGAEAVTIGAPTGPRGIVYRRADHAQPWFDELEQPAVYPAYHVIQGIAAASRRPLVATEISEPAALAALAWRAEDETVLWLANLTAAERDVALAGMKHDAARLRLLDEDSFVAATTDPVAFAGDWRPFEGRSLRLGAYAVATLRFCHA